MALATPTCANLTTGEIFLLSVNSAGQQAVPCPPPPGGTTTTMPTTTQPGTRDTTGANDISTRPSISDDGRVVAYNSDMCNLVPGGTADGWFAWDDRALDALTPGVLVHVRRLG